MRSTGSASPSLSPACFLLLLLALPLALPTAATGSGGASMPQAASDGQELEVDVVARVRSVVDGDTFDAFPVGRVRLADVNTPEEGEPGYEEAKAALNSLVGNKVVFLDVDDVSMDGPYHRLICLVYVRYNETHLLNVNKWLVAHGLADIVDYPNEFDPTTWTLYVEAPEEELPDKLYGELLAAYLELQEAYASLSAACNASTLQVEICSGDIHFPGELAEFYVLTAYNGVPVNASLRSALLLWHGQVLANLTAEAERVATGLFWLQYVLPADAPAGVYVLLVRAKLPEAGAEGVGLRAFLVSPTLSAWNATLAAIRGDVAVLKTEVGYVRFLLSQLNATLWDIRGDVALLRTELGEVRARVEDLLSLAEDVQAFLKGFSSAEVGVEGHQVLLLASSGFAREPQASGCLIEVSLAPPSGPRGLLLAVLPEELLASLGTTLASTVLLLDGQPTTFQHVELRGRYVLGLAYGPGEHEVALHLRGALDDDGDGLANYQELLLGTDPGRADTDRDLWPDGVDPWPRSPLVPDGLAAIPGALALALAAFAARRLRRRPAPSL